jgi:hypothetical protein
MDSLKTLTSSQDDAKDKVTEEKLQKSMAAYLSKYFLVFLEVWDTTHKFRIDLVIIHKSDTEKKYPIGVEIKLVGKKRGKDLALWLKQASNYASLNFNVFGKCLIVTCPQISDYYMKEGSMMHHHDQSTLYANNIGDFIGQFNVGELQKIDQHNCRIVFKGQVIWDSIYDELHANNYVRLCQK